MSEAVRKGSQVRKRRRTSKTGVVVSTRASKTAVIKVDRLMLHPRYHRVVRRSSKFMAHDEGEICHVGDVVEIVESRPLSARKRWRVRRIVRGAERVGEGAR
jgi:small subunit ribosomal protein S17